MDKYPDAGPSLTLASVKLKSFLENQCNAD